MSSTTSALVTGASRGIGLGVATRLAQRGFGLTIAGRNEGRLSEVASILHAHGAAGVVCMAGDVLDDGYLTQLLEAHVQRYTTLDALVLNAGAGSSGSIADFHPKRFDRQFAINLRSAFVLIQLALPVLRATACAGSQGAKIVAMSSITGFYAEEGLSGYGAAKAGLISLCRSINLEENVNGVQATAVAPGFVDTDMTEYKRGVLDKEQMIPVADVVEVVDMCLRLSRRSVVPEVVIARSGSLLSA
ncbi:SDR family oxidoreductase [Mycobacterium sp.]|uniref:SDR family NAD(P)-dependent oxidoreductase n=1 Tax=Mycobacterium sp. TaxID=1785 RepID=UPI0011FDB379|nr:SDR family oxidoreductase [Mycobacterium sp.]TAM65157.1 MAG: SDR family oxidoreductase [Mycobacterium sp.]